MANDRNLPVLRRVRNSITAAWRELRGPSSSKAQSILLWPDLASGVAQWHLVDYRTYAKEGYNLNTLIYSAIKYKVQAISSAPLVAFEGEVARPEFLAEDHPLAALVARPNEAMSWSDCQSLLTVYLNLSGNAYVYLERPETGALPTAMYPLRPDRVYILPEQRRGNGGRRNPVGYAYIPEGRSFAEGASILAEDMIHVKFPHPLDPMEGMGYGLSPVSPLAQSADVDNAVTSYLKDFFDHGAMFQSLLSYDMPLTDSQVEAIKERWREQYGGRDNWNEAGVMDSGGSYTRVSPTFSEMGFKEIDERSESRVLGPFGVPPILIGSRVGLDKATYSNYEMARRFFWEDTMLPELRMFEAAYQHALASEELDASVMFDLSGVPALRQDISDQVEAWTQLVDRGVPKNVAADVVGLDLPLLPDGDVVYMPANLLPSGRMEDERADADDAAENTPEGEKLARELFSVRYP